MPVDIFSPVVTDLDGKSTEELICFVSDAEQGCRAEALDRLLATGLDANYASYERAIRDNDNANLRNGAMEIMVRFGTQSIPRLLKLLLDRDEEVRNFSAVMLGDIGSSDAVIPLIGALHDEDANVRHGAAEALGRIGDHAALMPLLELLNEEFWVQYPAITALGSMKDKRAVPHLLELLKNPIIAEAVIDALGGIGDPRALVQLGDILSSPENTLSGAAVRAIVKIHQQVDDIYRYKSILETADLVTSLKEIISMDGIENVKGLIRSNSDIETKRAAIVLLGWLQDVSALDDFFMVLATEDYIDAVEGSILALGKMAVSRLVGALCHPEPNVRVVAVRSLRWLSGQEELHKVIPLLFDPSEQVQFEALCALKDSEADDEILPRLCDLVENAGDTVSIAAIEILGHYPFEKLQEFLKTIISSPNPGKRRRAAQVISCFGQGAPTSVFAFLLKDPDASVRMEAIKGVGLQKIVDCIPMLLELLGDMDNEVKLETINALAAFGDDAFIHKFIHLLGADHESLDYAIIRAIGKIGLANGGEALLTYLGNGGIARNIEMAIIETLGKIMYRPAVELITAKYLTSGDPDFRRLAVQVIAELSGIDGFHIYEESCRDPHWSVRIAALHAIGKTSGESSLPLLSCALSDSDSMVRKNAITILGDIKSPKAIALLVQQLADPAMGRHAFESLLKYGRHILPWLHRSMNGNYAVEIRERLIDLIGKIGDRKSIEPLLESLNDPHPAIKLAAIDSLVFCYDTVPLKRLFHIRRFDTSEEVKKRAAAALKSFSMETFF